MNTHNTRKAWFGLWTEMDASMDNKKNKLQNYASHGKNGGGNGNHGKKDGYNHLHNGQPRSKRLQPIDTADRPFDRESAAPKALSSATLEVKDNPTAEIATVEIPAAIPTGQEGLLTEVLDVDILESEASTKPVGEVISQTESNLDKQPVVENNSMKRADRKGNRCPSAKKAKEENQLRTYQEIMYELANPESKHPKPIDRCITFLDEIKQIKDLTAEQVQFFFASVNERLENGWAPFLAKATMNIDSNKLGNDHLILTELVNCFADILSSAGLDLEDLATVSKKFIDSQDAGCITAYLKEASKPRKQESPADAEIELHKITQQELACVVYSYLIINCRSFSSSDSKLLLKIDRAIAEYFGQIDMRSQAGKTVGSILALGQFSPKKIADLIYMYDGTAETIEKQADHISALSVSVSSLQARNATLSAEIDKRKREHADLVARLESLESEGAQLRKERSEAESMLEYERNRYQQQMLTKEAGLAEQLASALKLEIQAIRETAEYIDEDNQVRILRRLNRIDDILMEFGGSVDA